jgi:hypothetical protein
MVVARRQLLRGDFRDAASCCYADADLPDAEIKKLRAQKQQGHVSYKNALQDETSIPMSLTGFVMP